MALAVLPLTTVDAVPSATTAPAPSAPDFMAMLTKAAVGELVPLPPVDQVGLPPAATEAMPDQAIDSDEQTDDFAGFAAFLLGPDPMPQPPPVLPDARPSRGSELGHASAIDGDEAPRAVPGLPREAGDRVTPLRTAVGTSTTPCFPHRYPGTGQPLLTRKIGNDLSGREANPLPAVPLEASRSVEERGEAELPVSAVTGTVDGPAQRPAAGLVASFIADTADGAVVSGRRVSASARAKDEAKQQISPPVADAAAPPAMVRRNGAAAADALPDEAIPGISSQPGRKPRGGPAHLSAADSSVPVITSDTTRAFELPVGGAPGPMITNGTTLTTPVTPRHEVAPAEQRPPSGDIDLATDRLGAVQVAVEARDDALAVRFSVDRAPAAALLVAGSERLDAALLAGGSRLDALSVDVRDSGGRRGNHAPPPPPTAAPLMLRAAPRILRDRYA